MAGTTFQYARILPVYALYLRQCCKHLVRWWLGMLNMPCNLYGNFCTPVNVLIFEIFLYNSACSHFIDVPLCFIPLVLSEMMHPQRWVFPSNTIKQTQRFVFGYAYRKKNYIVNEKFPPGIQGEREETVRVCQWNSGTETRIRTERVPW